MIGEEVFIRDRLILDRKEGLLTFVFQAKPLLKGATAEVIYRINGERKSFSLMEPGISYIVEGDLLNLSRRNLDIKLDWRLLLGEEIDIWLEVTNESSSSFQIEEISVISLDAENGGEVNLGPPKEWSFYHNGWQSWSPAFARHVGDGLYVDPGTEGYRMMHQPHGRAKEFSSEWFTVIKGRGRREEVSSLLLGFITAKDQLAEVKLSVEGEDFRSLKATCYADGVMLSPGQRLFSERLVVAAGDTPFVLLEDYAKRVGEEMGARIQREPPTGWCSWYYFYGENTASDVLENLVEIDKEGLPLDYILIDDGYQAAIGDWLSPNERFPQGMKSVAQEIKARGHKPGIWIAPFGVNPESELFAAHPDWVLRDEKEEPVVAWTHLGESDIYSLDLSHPEVQEWLGNTFSIIRSDWGYELFKIDFLFAGAVEGRRYNPKMTRAQALRRGMEIIREAIGDDAFLLGCGAPLLPSIGIVDGMRIGPDVATNWKPLWRDLTMMACENAIRNSIARSFLHGKLWLNDPDCLLVRTRDDESELVLNEMRTLVSIVGLVGGLTLSGDNFSSIRKGRLKYLKQVIPPYGVSAIPLDLFENEMPRIFVLPVEREWGSWLVAGLINWEDRTKITTVHLSELGLPEGRYHVYNYWRRRYLGVFDERLTLIRHQPHETILLLLKPVSDEPQLLTSTFHVTQGGVEVEDVKWEGETLVVDLEKRGIQFGQLIFAIPDGYRVKETRVNGRRRGVNQIALNEMEIIGMGFTLKERAKVELEFNG